MASGEGRGGASAFEFLAGGGEMGARMRALDWSATPLGDPSGWPQSLRRSPSKLGPQGIRIVRHMDWTA